MSATTPTGPNPHDPDRTPVTNTLDAALALHHAGLCVIPAAADGTKRPGTGNWRDYMTTRPSEDQLHQWFGYGHPGVGVVGGKVSGGLVCLDVEARAVDEGVFAKYVEFADNSGLGEVLREVMGGYTEATASGGLHLLWRVDDGQGAENLKLARRPSTEEELGTWKAEQQANIDAEHDPAVRAKRQAKLDRTTSDRLPQVLIETKSEGGFLVTAPSSGPVHPNGKPWTLHAGAPSSIVTLSREASDALLELARMCDTMPAPEAPGFAQPATAPRADDGSLSPGDDYEARTDWSEILTPHGWTELFRSGNTRYWRRPGKRLGISATTGHADDRDRLFVFTTSTEFEPETPITKFAAYALLEYASDYKAAAKALSSAGYGRMPAAPVPPQNPTADTAPTPAPTADAPAEAEPEPVRIDISGGPRSIINIIDGIDGGAIPNTYVRNGTPVQISQVSGEALIGAKNKHRIPQVILDLTPDSLVRLLARHAHTYKAKQDKEGEWVETPAIPAATIVKPALSETHWPNMLPLRAIATAPIIRPDGSILQQPGYDQATALYYAPQVDVPQVPDIPDVAQVADARQFVLDYVLGDFPWDSPASRANFFALLMTPLLRSYVGGLSPLGAVSATAPGSGKTLLTEVIGRLFGLSSRAWVQDDTELRKSITALLASSSDPVVVLDNIGEFDEANQPTLAKLITSEVWHDRELGSSKQLGIPNDRLWLITGNSIKFGGDIPSRAVLVTLDPRMPDPDQRTGFRIPDLGVWLQDEDNRAQLLHHMLVLARDWIVNGAPRGSVAMRNFREWANAMAGFTAHHGITGFMDNRREVAAHDDEGIMWRAFLATWHRRFGSRPVAAAELLKDARPAWPDNEDLWNGTFIANRKGNLPSVVGLGKMLGSKNGRFYGNYSLHKTVDGDTNTGLYYVARHSDEELAAAQEGRPADTGVGA